VTQLLPSEKNHDRFVRTDQPNAKHSVHLISTAKLVKSAMASKDVGEKPRPETGKRVYSADGHVIQESRLRRESFCGLSDPLCDQVDLTERVAGLEAL